MPLPDMIINGLEAYICCGGERLREFAKFQAHGDPDAKVCNIISEPDEEFEIYVKDLQPRRGKCRAFWVKVFAEGKLITEEPLRRGETLRIDSAKDEEGVARKLLFSAARLIESETVESEGVLDKVGLLEVVVHPAKFKAKKAKRKIPASILPPTTTPRKDPPAPTAPKANDRAPSTNDSRPSDDTHSTDGDLFMLGEVLPTDRGVLTERSKKHGFNVVTLGDPIHVPPKRPLSPNPSPTSSTTTNPSPTKVPSPASPQSPNQSAKVGSSVKGRKQSSPKKVRTPAKKRETVHWFEYEWEAKHVASFGFRHKSREMLEAAGIITHRHKRTISQRISSAGHDNANNDAEPTQEEPDDDVSSSASSDYESDFQSDSDYDPDASSTTGSHPEPATPEPMNIEMAPDDGTGGDAPAKSNEPGATESTSTNEDAAAATVHTRLAIMEISTILSKARTTKSSFKWPRFLDYTPSGDLSLGTVRNAPVLTYKETLEGCLCGLDGIESHDQSDIQAARKAAVIEIQRVLDNYDNALKRMKKLYLSRNPPAASTPPALTSSTSTPTVPIENNDDATMTDLPPPSTPPPIPVSDGPSPSAGTKRKHDDRDVSLAAQVEEDIKPIIKPDPDAASEPSASPKKKRITSKMKVLLAKRALLEVDVAIAEQEEEEDAKRRKHAVDLTLSDDE